jgi:Winged helix-turn helix
VIRFRHLIRGKQMVKWSKAAVRRLKTALRWKMPVAQRQRIQMVLLRESGMTQPAIAAAMGVSLSTVNRAHMAYDHGGIEALKPRPNGGRKVSLRRAPRRSGYRSGGRSQIRLPPIPRQ